MLKQELCTLTMKQLTSVFPLAAKLNLWALIVLLSSAALSGCGRLNYYSANPVESWQQEIPGASKKRTNGHILVSGIRNTKGERTCCMSSRNDLDKNYDIDGYYVDPQVKHYINLTPSSIDIIPYILPLMRTEVKTVRGTDIWIPIRGTIANGSVSYSIPAFDSDFPLKKISLNNNRLQPQIFLVEKEPEDNVRGIYGWITLIYPDLVPGESWRCAEKSPLALSPYRVDVSYTQGSSFSEDYFKKHQSAYLSDEKYKLRVDLTNLNLCLVPDIPKN